VQTDHSSRCDSMLCCQQQFESRGRGSCCSSCVVRQQAASSLQIVTDSPFNEGSRNKCSASSMRGVSLSRSYQYDYFSSYRIHVDQSSKTIL
jgi:hypothetical protein